MRNPRGSVTVELVVLAPVLVLLMAFVAATGLHASAATTVKAAVDGAARTASTSSRGRMVPEARMHVWRALVAESKVCASVETDVRVALNANPRTVIVSAMCRLSNSGSSWFMTHDQSVSAESTEVIDVFTFR